MRKKVSTALDEGTRFNSLWLRRLRNALLLFVPMPLRGGVVNWGWGWGHLGFGVHFVINGRQTQIEIETQSGKWQYHAMQWLCHCHFNTCGEQNNSKSIWLRKWSQPEKANLPLSLTLSQICRATSKSFRCYTGMWRQQRLWHLRSFLRCFWNFSPS